MLGPAAERNLRIGADDLVPGASAVQPEGEFDHRGGQHDGVQPRELLGAHLLGRLILDQLLHGLDQDLETCGEYEMDDHESLSRRWGEEKKKEKKKENHEHGWDFFSDARLA